MNYTNKEVESVENLASCFVQQFILPGEDTLPKSSKYIYRIYSYIMSIY